MTGETFDPTPTLPASSGGGTGPFTGTQEPRGAENSPATQSPPPVNVTLRVFRGILLALVIAAVGTAILWQYVPNRPGGAQGFFGTIKEAIFPSEGENMKVDSKPGTIVPPRAKPAGSGGGPGPAKTTSKGSNKAKMKLDDGSKKGQEEDKE